MKMSCFREKKTLFIKAMFFCVAFCYPFRRIIQNYLPLKEFVILYLPTILMIGYYKIFQKNLQVGIYITVIFIYCFFRSSFSVDYITAAMWLINIIFGILLSDIFLQNHFKLNDAVPYIIGVLLCNVLLQPFVVSRMGFNITYMSLSRIPFIYGDIDVGPNGWSQLLCIAFLFTLMIIQYGKRKYKLLFYLMLFLELVFLFQTQSRGSMLSVVIIIFFLFCIKIYEENYINRKTFCKILFFLCMVFIGVMIFIFQETRLDLGRFSDLSSGERGKIWKMTLDVYFSLQPIKLFFGVGTGGTGVFLAQHNILSYGLDASEGHISAHSTYLDTLLSLGIVGFILIVGYWIYACWKIFKCKSKRYYIIFPIYILTSGLTYHMFSNWSYCVCIAVTETILLKYCTNHYNLFFYLKSKNINKTTVK